ncbi:hypothetical protein SAMN05444161_1677 [Rhizobiales bacterium GAS191]|nr:hypothetical protein SAMN05444161_1677 [Rhizobiales bacterium GAS191]
MPLPDTDLAALPGDLDDAVAAAIAVCDNDARAAVRALIVANAYLEEELKRLDALISRGYARGRIGSEGRHGRSGANGR